MNPYPGLRPFRAEEAHWFFGREALDDTLTTRVHVTPLTLMFARSGVGKSSFLSCRLIPALGKDCAVDYVNEWGGAPAGQLIHAGVDRLSSLADDHDDKPVLILDQFEDTFKLEQARAPMWDTLAELANVPESPVHILISMREEWLGAWGEASDYLAASNISMVRLAPLRDSEVRRAILRPASVDGTREFTQELAEEILHDLKTPNAYGLGDRYVEPGLLQVVCHRLWTEAAKGNVRIVDVPLYAELGRADQILRQHVWVQLQNAGSEGCVFSAYDRVIWAGLIPHLSAAHGVKAIVNPTMLCKRLRTVDLGIAGPAVLDYELKRNERNYLSLAPEKRGAPPERLLTWITRVLNAAEIAGLVKKQRGLREGDRIYELSHDSLSSILQQFAVEFETWIRSRWYKVLGVLIGLVVILPVVLIVIAATKTVWEALLYLALVPVGIAAYVLLVWLMMKLLTMIFEALLFPIMRRLVKGRVPDSKRPNM